MNTLSILPSPLLLLPSKRVIKSLPPIHQPQSQPPYSSSTNHHSFPTRRRSHIIAAAAAAATPPPPSTEGTVSVVNFEDLMEKDWSFLESDTSNSAQQHHRNMNRIISAGGDIGKTSRVLVSIGSEEFVDLLVEKSHSDHLILIHESLFVLAGIKEKYDQVKCWQGELIDQPENWGPLDVVFLYFLPALPFAIDQIFEALAKCCLFGARVIISHPHGREVVEQQRREYPDVVISVLPDKIALLKVAADHSFKLVEYVDESGFYLAVLKFCKVE